MEASGTAKAEKAAVCLFRVKPFLGDHLSTSYKEDLEGSELAYPVRPFLPSLVVPIRRTSAKISYMVNISAAKAHSG